MESVFYDTKLDPGGELHEKILDHISWRAEGVFIWVYVVLQNVKAGIEQWDETWDDTYDRASMLPPDLMKLYKDMWSRLGDHNEKYIKRAARYFQYSREMWYDSYIGSLALVADDQMLEAFSRPNEVPSLGEFIKMCGFTLNTLLPVSGGLLEVYTRSNNPETAIDFLDSDEGKKVFERHALGPGDILSLGVKVELALRSIYRHKHHPLEEVWSIMSKTFHWSASKEDLTQVSSDLLSTIHQCALNKSRGLIRPPYWINYQNFFLFEACTYGFYEYVEEWLESSDDYDFTASTYDPIGACDDHAQSKRPDPSKRYQMIQDILKRYSRSDMGVLEPSAVRDASDNTMLAWRCFLLHEGEWRCIHSTRGKEEQKTVEILELFIKAGVMAESPGSRYLVAVQYSNLEIVRRLTDEQSDLGYGILRHQRSRPEIPTIYTEPNDAFLLQQLSSNISGTSELI
ncbi:hypothetical protein N7517_005624 [Penicillium concentricum]|uniref:Uncharacterized protein n=1 Tax=Penicillium concentricum TaxID=293559 RepID=A0A9W9SCH6_9EURO|nr:uncharacterized protein N7517_005624 [Penicillium concentricum]KAJ5373618.1 hypothetical protein N7517_005624 [Penicillium concentricum]